MLTDRELEVIGTTVQSTENCKTEINLLLEHIKTLRKKVLREAAEELCTHCRGDYDEFDPDPYLDDKGKWRHKYIGHLYGNYDCVCYAEKLYAILDLEKKDE